MYIHKYIYIFSYYFFVFCIFLPLPPLRGQPAVIMPTLLAPQQGMTCPCRLKRCWIRTRNCRFYSLVHYHWATKSRTCMYTYTVGKPVQNVVPCFWFVLCMKSSNCKQNILWYTDYILYLPRSDLPLRISLWKTVGRSYIQLTMESEKISCPYYILNYIC